MALVPNMAVKFKHDGAEREIVFPDVTFGDWADLKKQVGFTPKTLFDQLGEYDVEAIAALIWLERRRREPTVGWQTVVRGITSATEFEVLDVTLPEEDEAEPDPTTAESS